MEEEEEDTGRRVVHAYYALEGLYAVAMGCTLSVDDLFLLHAGLSLWGVFLAGASFTAAIVLFELPTGVIADTVGRRGSVLASLAVRTAGTLAYVLAGWAAPFLGLGACAGLPPAPPPPRANDDAGCTTHGPSPLLALSPLLWGWRVQGRC